MDKKEMKLADMVPQEWFEDLDASTFWLRIYTTLPVAQAKIQDYFEGAICTYAIDSQPIKLAILGLDRLELSEVKNGIVHSHPENGGMVLSVKVDKIELPKSSYIFFFAPFKVNGVEGNENKTKSNLDQLEAILSARLGSNTLHSLVYDGVHPLTDASQSQNYGSAVQALNPCEGPFLAKSNWEKAEQIISVIESIEDE